jgi:methyl-accepting chemotaxis protein
MLSRTGLLNISVGVLPLIIAGTVVVGRDPAEEPLGWTFFGILILLAAGAGAFVQTRVKASGSSSLGNIVEALRGVAKGDFSTYLDPQGAGEYTELVEVTNESLNQIGGVMKQVADSAGSMVESSKELVRLGQDLNNSAGETSGEASSASSSAASIDHNLQTVATATTEMTASIQEIARNSHEAASIATAAVEVADTANTTVARLGDSSAEIGNVIKLITSIAEQTNLLALNATIEAARAGEAGKGFAVVATEVKELAKETAKATEDISSRIDAIQSDVRAAVDAIAEIGTIIRQVNELQVTIAGAVEEQSATTSEIGHNVQAAANGSGEIAKSVSGVAEAVEVTTAYASDSEHAATRLSGVASAIQDMMTRYRFRN